MKKIALLAALSALILLGIWSCKQDNKISPSAQPQYNMNFTISAGAAPLYFNRTVTGVPYRYFLKQCRFYVGYPSLIKTDGSLVPLSNLFLVAYDSSNPYNSIYGRNFSFTVPSGSYKGIQFGIGMPPQIMDTVKHHHYGANDPLTDWGMFWPVVTNNDFIYRNIAIDIVSDTTKAQNGPVNRDDVFHILQDDTTLNLYHTIVYNDAFTVGSGDSHTTTFNLDFNNVFFNAANPIDLRNVTGIDMDKGNIPEAILGEAINANFYSSLTVK